jgi:hypothetical protein
MRNNIIRIRPQHHITIFRSITMFNMTDSMNVRIIHKILAVPQNTVMDLNNVMQSKEG